MPGELIPIVLFICGAAVVIFGPMARAWARKLENESSAKSLSGNADARLERMEHAIEAIAVEIERISEGQRFTTKLLAERHQAPRIEQGGEER